MNRKPPARHNVGIDLNERALAKLVCDYPVQLVHGCAHRFLAEYDYQVRELAYSDPPYKTSTNSSRPSSWTAKDETAFDRAGTHGKGKKLDPASRTRPAHEQGPAESLRLLPTR